MSKDASKILKASSSLGRELVPDVPGVWSVGVGFGATRQPRLRLQVMCTKSAKQQILEKYKDGKYQGFKIHFEITSHGPVFAAKTSKKKAPERNVRPKGDEWLPGKGVYW